MHYCHDTVKNINKIFRCVVFCFLLFFPNQGALAGDGVVSTIQRANRLISNRDCGKAWSMVWPLARQRNPYGLAWLGSAMYFAFMVPPSSHQVTGKPNLQNIHRDVFTLWLHAWRHAQDSRPQRQILNDIFFVGTEDPRYLTIKKCMLSSSDKEACVNVAISLKLTEQWSSFVRRIERANNPAYCWMQYKPFKSR